MSQIKVVGFVGFLIIFFGAIISGISPSAGQAVMGIGGITVVIAVYIMLAEIHETITSEEEE